MTNLSTKSVIFEVAAASSSIFGWDLTDVELS